MNQFTALCVSVHTEFLTGPGPLHDLSYDDGCHQLPTLDSRKVIGIATEMLPMLDDFDALAEAIRDDCSRGVSRREIVGAATFHCSQPQAAFARRFEKTGEAHDE
jgi:hypothetical protein